FVSQILHPSFYSGLYPEDTEFQLRVSFGTQISCRALQDKCYSASFSWLCSTVSAVAN
ncbi:Neuron Navigator 3, partial [Manis pentadactyla]